MAKEKYIIENLIKKQKFNEFNELYDYLDHERAIFNLETIDVLISDIIELYKMQIPDYHLFLHYQILINKIVNNPSFEVTYNENTKIVSLLEMVRILTLILKDSSLKFFSGCLDVSVKIVEVNKRGLKIKHFAYQSDYNIGDLVYISTPRPANFYLVSDFYEVKLKDLLRYIIHISCECVYNFDISYDAIAKYNVSKIKDQEVVKVLVDGENVLATTRFKHFLSQVVEVLVNDEIRIGYIIGDVFFGEEKIKNKILRPILYEKRKYLKEKRTINDDIVYYLFNGWNVQSLKDNLQNMNRKKYIVIFAVLERLMYLIEHNKEKGLNEIEEINLYYRPYINFLLENVNVNNFYYLNNGIIFSLLHYLSLLKMQNIDILDFLLDKKYDFQVPLVDINVYGRIKTCFAYDFNYQIGEPVLIQIEDIYPIAFVHEVYTKPFYELIEDIEYYLSTEIVQIRNLKKIVQERSNFENKVVIVKIYDGDETVVAISDNYVPYVGESVLVSGKFAIVISEPVAVDKDNIDLENYVHIEEANTMEF